MKLNRNMIAPVFVLVATAFSGGWLLQRDVAPDPDLVDSERLFRDVIEHISARYVDETSSSELYRHAIEGLLQELGDPHTALMTPEQYADLRVQTEGEYGGLGIEIDLRDGWITVISPLPDSPAERAGLQPGDRILEVEGESTEGWSTEDAVSVLRGPKGEPVQIMIGRTGVDDPIPVEVVRDDIHYAAVQARHMVAADVGYVQLRMFSETATSEVREAIDDLRGRGMNRLVLDLRTNPGGLLEQGIALSDLFLPRGDGIVETRARDPRQNHTFRAPRGDRYEGMPVVVLVNEYSASASEIVAGALQDHDRAVVIGTPTFGKGSVQTLFPLSAGHFLKMTTGRWYTPVGRSIERERDLDADPVALLEDDEDIAAELDLEQAPGSTPREAGDVVDREQRPAYRTDSGRVVYGGGGIVPDIIVRDTYNEQEMELRRAIFGAEVNLNDLLFQYAGEYLRRTSDIRPDFQVTPAMRAEVRRLLEEEGVEADDDVWEDAARMIDSLVEFQIALREFGRPAALERATQRDATVRAAIELLERANDPASLIGLTTTGSRAQRR